MRILFTSIPGVGHLAPLIPFAREMQRRGHEVRVAAASELAPMIAAAGLDHVAVGTPTADEREAFSARISHLPPRDRAPYFLGGVFLGLLPRAAHPALKAFADTWRPDLVVREASEFAGAIVAEQSEIAHVRVSVSNGHSLTRTVAPFDKLRRAFGLEPDEGRCLRRARAFSAFPVSMEPPGGDGADLPQFRVAPTREAISPGLPDWAAPSPEPRIYMTFGTVMGSSEEAKAVFRAALDAVAAQKVSALMTTGPSMDVAALGTIPENVVLRDFVPQSAVFPHVSAVLCHGGSGSVLGALSAGLPLVVMPIGADQPENARAVAAVGAGIAIDVPDPDTTSSALKTVLTDPAYRAAAQRISKEMAAHPSIEMAVDEMLRQVREAPETRIG